MITTNSGIELDVRAVSPVALRNLLFGSGIFRRMVGVADKSKAEVLTEIQQSLSQQEQLRLGAESSRLYNYICAYGVSNDPPEDAIEQLQAMGFQTNSDATSRMHWLQMFVLDEQDTNNLLSEVIRLTFNAS